MVADASTDDFRVVGVTDGHLLVINTVYNAGRSHLSASLYSPDLHQQGTKIRICADDASADHRDLDAAVLANGSVLVSYIRDYSSSQPAVRVARLDIAVTGAMTVTCDSSGGLVLDLPGGHVRDTAVIQRPDILNGYVVAWSSQNYQLNSTTDSDWGIYARAWSPVTGFSLVRRLNKVLLRDQRYPRLASLQANSLAVTWTGRDADSFGVFCRFFTASLEPSTDDVLLNVNAEIGKQYSPRVATLAAGRAAFAWTAFTSPFDGDSGGVVILNAGPLDVQTLPGSTAVNTRVSGYQRVQDVASLVDGSIAVIFSSASDSDNQGPYQLLARRYTSAGAVMTSVFPVDGSAEPFTASASLDNMARVAALTSGEYAVAWRRPTEGIVAHVFKPQEVPITIGSMRFTAWRVGISGSLTFQQQFDPVEGTLSVLVQAADGSAMPAWLSYQDATMTLSGVPPAGAAGTLMLRALVTNSVGGSLIAPFSVTVFATLAVTCHDFGHEIVVQPGHTWPMSQLELNIVSTSGRTDVAAHVALLPGPPAPAPGTLPGVEFNADTRSYTLHGHLDTVTSSLAAWSFTPAAEFSARATITVTIDDGGVNIPGRCSVVIFVNGTNVKPVPSVPISPFTVSGGPFSFQIPENAFYDANADPLRYEVSLSNGLPLPSWCQFSSATRTLSGTYPASVGTADLVLDMRVLAYDDRGPPAYALFRATFHATGPAPAPAPAPTPSPAPSPTPAPAPAPAPSPSPTPTLPPPTDNNGSTSEASSMTGAAAGGVAVAVIIGASVSLAAWLACTTRARAKESPFAEALRARLALRMRSFTSSTGRRFLGAVRLIERECSQRSLSLMGQPLRDLFADANPDAAAMKKIKELARITAQAVLRAGVRRDKVCGCCGYTLDPNELASKASHIVDRLANVLQPVAGTGSGKGGPSRIPEGAAARPHHIIGDDDDDEGGSPAGGGQRFEFEDELPDVGYAESDDERQQISTKVAGSKSKRSTRQDQSADLDLDDLSLSPAVRNGNHSERTGFVRRGAEAVTEIDEELP